MMRVWFCVVCRRAYEVTGSEEEVAGLFENDYACITPLCRGRLRRAAGSEWKTIQGCTLDAISYRSFFRAVMGFGKFEGEAAACKRVIELLMSNNIVAVDARPVGNPERTIVNQIVFVDGTRLHFGSSSHGACCYYVEAAGPSCVEVLDREQPNVVHPEAAAEVSNPDREEVGRAPDGQPGVDEKEQREPSS